MGFVAPNVVYYSAYVNVSTNVAKKPRGEVESSTTLFHDREATMIPIGASANLFVSFSMNCRKVCEKHTFPGAHPFFYLGKVQ